MSQLSPRLGAMRNRNGKPAIDVHLELLRENQWLREYNRSLLRHVESELGVAWDLLAKLKTAAQSIPNAGTVHLESSRPNVETIDKRGELTLESADASPNGLTAREVQVLKCVAWGATNKEIAHQLGISIKTVEFHKAGAVA